MEWCKRQMWLGVSDEVRVRDGLECVMDEVGGSEDDGGVVVGEVVGGVVRERLIGRSGRPWYGNSRDEVVRRWVARLAAVNAEQVSVRWGLDVRTARRGVGPAGRRRVVA